MQTPPDSDTEAKIYPLHQQTDSDESPALNGEISRTAKRHASTTSRDTALIRRSKNPQRNVKEDGDSRNGRAPSALLVHKPTSATTRLRSELITMLVRTKRAGTWFDLLPSRVGYSDAVDSAAKAIVKASEHVALGTSVSQDSCLGSYGKAIISLRDSMGKSASSDEMLITVSLLVTFERMFAYTSVQLKSHMHGVVAVLMTQARTSNKPPSEITRALHYTFWPVTFIGPCVMGVPSPFEAPRWLEMGPVVTTKDKMKSPWEVVAKLKKLHNQHFIRLPRLIMLVKGLQTAYNAEQVDAALEIAKDLLYNYEDTDAENELLHNVQIQKAATPANADLTPYHMTFTTMEEFEAVMHYWSTRIFLNRLCRRLNGLYPTKYREHDLRPKSELEAQVSRMAASVLMACHWGLEKGETGESMVILNLTAVWGVLNDFDVFAARGFTPSRVRTFLQQCGQKIMRPAGADPAEEVARRLDAGSEIFVGGQTTGILAFTFRKPGGDG